MSLETQRIFFYDGSTLTDKSVNLSDLNAGTEALTIDTTTDYLYIASDLPFNNRWFEVTSANGSSATLSAEIWDGSAWTAAVDEVDFTLSSGATLAQSGVFRFAVDRNENWARESTTEDITNLTSLRVYNMYWMRLQPSAQITVTLNYVGFKFAKDTDLYDVYPELSRSSVLTAFEAGKTDWNEQLVLASEDVVRQLKQERKIFNSNQILDHEQFRVATVHRCAEMVYYSFSGEDMDKKRMDAHKYYKNAINEVINYIDRDLDGRLDPVEKQPYQTTLVRR